jgi:hypothetical protein
MFEELLNKLFDHEAKTGKPATHIYVGRKTRAKLVREMAKFTRVTESPSKDGQSSFYSYPFVTVTEDEYLEVVNAEALSDPKQKIDSPYQD